MKEEINKLHPRNLSRTDRCQEYRDNLASILKEKRSKGEVGALLAEDYKNQQLLDVDYMKYILSRDTKSYKDIALTWIEKLGKQGAFYVGTNLNKFKGLDKDIALNLIENGFSEFVEENISLFKA